jgi:RimJ/RimL family protein N-acetyltransferase
MSPAIVALRRLAPADLTAITPWFEDPDTRRSLGGPEWPAAMLDHGERAVGEMFSGAVQTAAHHYLALADDGPVGYIDCGTFDRCTVYGGEEQKSRSSSRRSVTGSIAFAIDPSHRRQRLATNMIQALTHHPDLAGGGAVRGRVEPENHGSRGALEAARFRVRSPVPDCEGMLCYLASTNRASSMSP